MTRIAIFTLTLLAGAGALAGCGIHDPSSARRATPHPAAPARPLTAASVAREFALTWTTWDWRSLPDVDRRCAALATGDLRRSLLREATSARELAHWRRARMVSSGQILTAEVEGDGTRAQATLAVREFVRSRRRDDAGDRSVRVYRAALVFVRGRWLVADWGVLT